MRRAIVADESRIRALGGELLGRVAAQRDPTAALLEWLLRDEAAKLRLFRFIDVLPVLAEDHEVVEHLREYFGGQAVPFAGLVRVALGLRRAGRLGEALVAAALRRSVRRLARRFIAAETADEAIAAALAARRAGQAFTLDLLGEACVSVEEAREYQRRYLMLVERLGVVAPGWPGRAWIRPRAGRCPGSTSPSS